VTRPDPAAGDDRLWRFIFTDLPVRGAFVQVGSAWRELLSHRSYPDNIRRLLGETMAAAPLLASTIKFEGRLTLQAEGDGPVTLLLVQIDHQLEMRGVIRHGADARGSHVSKLFGNGRLGLIIDPLTLGQRYQATVPLTGRRFQESLCEYFERSEQLPTWLNLVAGAEGFAGLMLQRMPGFDASDPALLDAWKRLGMLAATLNDDEMLTLPCADIVARLFAEDGVRLFDPQPVMVRCRCSHGRISELLLGLGREEIQSVLAEQGQLEIECGFCGRRYQYKAREVAELFQASARDPETRTRH
jgi:molecular chaperone Hsp33